jgi:uncharacterized lipoprotein YbaY
LVAATVALGVGTVLTTGCSENGGTTARVTGTVTYLQSRSLPQDAEVYVVLEDLSLQGKPVGTIAVQSIPAGGEPVPVSFRLEYDPSRINESRTYSVRAEIRVDGETRYMSGQSYPVLTHGAGHTADVVVMAVQRTTPATMPLIGTYWRLTRLGGRSVIAVGDAKREPHLTLVTEMSRAVATGGCNQLVAGYVLSGSNSIRFSEFASTRMTCPDVMAQERALEKALVASKSYRIEGARLALMDRNGAVVAHFEAAKPEDG